MKYVILISALLLSIVSYAQKWNHEIICAKDTLIIKPKARMKHHSEENDIAKRKPYRILQCSTRSDIGLRMDIAFSNYYYGDKTASWLGQHGGPNFNFIFVYDKINVGLRFKPWTIEPKKELDFNGQTLPTTANLNNIRFDYYVGYSFDFDKLISLEPYIGYNRTRFIVINEEELNQEFNIKNTGGLIIGTTLNKYFKIRNYGYISIFGTLGYGFVNYQKVHPDLDNGYVEWNIGIALKSFAIKRLSRRVG
jgi:hypothetical protein